METKYGLEKTDDGRYQFTAVNDDIERIEKVSKQSLIEHYKELLEKKNNTLQMVSQIVKESETNKVPYDEELEHFLELANKAAKYKKHLEAERTRETTIKMLDGVNNEIKMIEAKVPEVKRLKK